MLTCTVFCTTLTGGTESVDEEECEDDVWEVDGRKLGYKSGAVGACVVENDDEEYEGGGEVERVRLPVLFSFLAFEETAGDDEVEHKLINMIKRDTTSTQTKPNKISCPSSSATDVNIVETSSVIVVLVVVVVVVVVLGTVVNVSVCCGA